MKVIFTKEAFAKFVAYIEGTPFEISGFGKVEKKDGNLVISDIKIFDQVVSSGDTTLDSKALAKFWDELIVAGEDTGKWKLWFHSHVFMQTFFSAIDTATIDDFDMEVPEENWMLSIVANKLGKMLCRVDIYEPMRCILNNLQWEIAEGEEVTVDVTQEIQDKVKTDTFGLKEDIIVFGKTCPLRDKDGKVLSVEERIAILRHINHFPSNGQLGIDVIDGA